MFEEIEKLLKAMLAELKLIHVETQLVSDRLKSIEDRLDKVTAPDGGHIDVITH